MRKILSLLVVIAIIAAVSVTVLAGNGGAGKGFVPIGGQMKFGKVEISEEQKAEMQAKRAEMEAKMAEQKAKMEARVEIVKNLTDEQKAEVYAIMEAQIAADFLMLDKRVELGLITAEEAADMKAKRLEIFEANKADGKVPFVGGGMVGPGPMMQNGPRPGMANGPAFGGQPGNGQMQGKMGAPGMQGRGMKMGGGMGKGECSGDCVHD